MDLGQEIQNLGIPGLLGSQLERAWSEESQLLQWLHENPDHQDAQGVWEMLERNGRRMTELAHSLGVEWIERSHKENERRVHNIFYGIPEEGEPQGR